MSKNIVSLLFKSRLTSFEKLNDNFLKAKCYVLALGKNQNKSYFAKDNVDKAYPTLAYVPVIGHLINDENGNYYLGGHDYKIDIADGFKLKSQCIPFGVAIPSPEPQYEEVVEADGTLSQYLICDVVIWIGRYPELTNAIYDSDTYFNHSMEIMFSKSEPLSEDNSYANIIDFSFDALCMLNKSDDPKFNVKPCFPSAAFKPANYSLDQSEFKLLMEEMKNELKLLFTKSNELQGGTNLNDKLKILEKFGKTVDDLDFSIDDMDIKDLALKMEELFGASKTEPLSFSATYKQKRQALNDALKPIIVKDATGNYIEETYFYVEDFSDEYVFVEKDHWTKDNYECKFGRYSYTFDESALTASLTSNFEEMIKVWLTLDEKSQLDAERAKYTVIEQNFAEYKASHSMTNDEAEKLAAYKSEKEAETIFSKYKDKIGETAEFAELKKHISDYSLDALEKECIYIVGLHASELSFSKEPVTRQSLKFSVGEPDNSNTDEPYGGLVKKHLNK